MNVTVTLPVEQWSALIECVKIGTLRSDYDKADIAAIDATEEAKNAATVATRYIHSACCDVILGR
jgi:hypothetical protein